MYGNRPNTEVYARMNRKKIAPYALSILLALGVGALAAILTREGMRYFASSTNQPPLSPPPWLFPVVWSLLYILMGYGAGRMHSLEDSPAKKRALTLYYAQLAMNFVWNFIFFAFRAYLFALAWLLILWALVYCMICAFRRLDKRAANLQIPYLIWLSFAAYLNFGVYLLN